MLKPQVAIYHHERHEEHEEGMTSYFVLPS